MNHPRLNCDDILRVLSVCSDLGPLVSMPRVLQQAIHDRLMYRSPRLSAKVVRLGAGPLRSLASLMRLTLSTIEHTELSLPSLVLAVSLQLDEEVDHEIADWKVELVGRLTEAIRAVAEVPVPA